MIKDLIVTGHSLGGFAAMELVGRHCDNPNIKKAYAFNGTAVSREASEKYSQVTNPPPIFHFCTEGDPVPSAGGKDQRLIGKWLAVKIEENYNPLHSHCIYSLSRPGKIYEVDISKESTKIIRSFVELVRRVAGYVFGD